MNVLILAGHQCQWEGEVDDARFRIADWAHDGSVLEMSDVDGGHGVGNDTVAMYGRDESICLR